MYFVFFLVKLTKLSCTLYNYNFNFTYRIWLNPCVVHLILLTILFFNKNIIRLMIYWFARISTPESFIGFLYENGIRILNIFEFGFTIYRVYDYHATIFKHFFKKDEFMNLKKFQNILCLSVYVKIQIAIDRARAL